MVILETEPEKTIVFFGLALKLDKAEDSKSIVDALRRQKDAECLDLRGNTLGIEAAEPIGQALRENKCINRLLLSDLFTGRLKTEIAPALRHLSAGIVTSGAHLVELDLSDNAFGPNGVVGVVDLLASPACFSLEILRMNNQGLGHEGCRQLTEALEKGRQASCKRGLKLKVFSAGRNRLENVGAKLLSEVLSDMGSLEEFSVYQNGIGIHGVEGVYALVKILKKNPNLRVLNLSDNSLTPKGGEAIAKALPFLSNLEELHLSDCILRSSGTRALASSLGDPDVAPNLRVLNLTGNEINRSVGISLILSLGDKSRLELLDLNANEFGKSGIRAIIRTLDSVNLSHTLPSRDSAEHTFDEEPVGDQSYIAAFDDDQGSASEEEEEGSDEEGYEDGPDDAGDQPSYEEDDDEEADTSFNTVEERPLRSSGNNSAFKNQTASNFSFREIHDALGEKSCPGGEQTENTSNKSGPFGGGLFSSVGLMGTDRTDAGTVRSKLWPTSNSNGLFSTTNLGDSLKKGNLFSPPLLSIPSSNMNTKSKESTETAVDDLSNRMRQFLMCNTGVKDTENLIESIRRIKSIEENFPHSRIRDCVKFAVPEDVVRLSLALSRRIGNLNEGSQVSHVAVGLLASVLVPPQGTISRSGDANVGTSSVTSRAVNCLLVHLGAIKAEKGGPDDLLSTCDPAEAERTRVSYLSVTRRLTETYANTLPTSVRNCLCLLLSEQRKRERLCSPVKKPSVGGEFDRLRDDVLSLLQNQLAGMKLM
ncbi:unnamed protein product [Calicophoron daubneyi]|uniref:Ran GTPase-activating protein 1 n=1 Tax=Calicophoron daubneyi TaxID=300641 RepID=A0AAV2T1Z2_CALDB